MSDSHTPHAGDRSDEALGHEPTDASIKGVVIFLIVLFGVVILVQPFVLWMVNSFSAQARMADPLLSPLADTEQIPPPPRLQADPTADMVELRRIEAERLGSYAWIDKQQGIVRIPVDRAIDLLLERGLPVPQPAAEESPEGQQRQNGERAPSATGSSDDRADIPGQPRTPSEPSRQQRGSQPDSKDPTRRPASVPGGREEK